MLTLNENKSMHPQNETAEKAEKEKKCEVCGDCGYLNEYMGQYEWCANCEPENYKLQHEQVLTQETEIPF